MAVSTGNEYVWAFVHWAERNPYNSLNSVHWDEVKAMLQIFGRVNETNGTATEADPGLATGAVYSDAVDIPDLATTNIDTAGVSFETPTDTKCDHSRYPESHIFAYAGAPI